MAFPVTTIDQPTVSNGLQSCQAGSKIVSFAADGVVTVFDMSTETTSAWQMTSPGANGFGTARSAPWYDAASGKVWVATSGTPWNIVQFDPVTGATNVYLTAQSGWSGNSPSVALVGAYLVILVGQNIYRFDTATGIMSGGLSTGSLSAIRPLVIGGKVYYYRGTSSRVIYDPLTHTLTTQTSGVATVGGQWAYSSVLGRWVTARNGGGVIAVDPVTADETTIPTVSGFHGAAMVEHTDGRLYSKVGGNVTCWDPATGEVASAAHAGTSNFAAAYGGNLYFPAL